jgi:hypothetical protein
MANKGYVRAIEKWRSVKPELRKKVVAAIRAVALGLTDHGERDAMRAGAAVLEQGRARDFGTDFGERCAECGAIAVCEVALEDEGDSMPGAGTVLDDLPRAEDFGRNPFATQAIASAVAVPTTDDAMRLHGLCPHGRFGGIMCPHCMGVAGE